MLQTKCIIRSKKMFMTISNYNLYLFVLTFTSTMATGTEANIYDPDAEIGFDMRNAQMYNDSDDDEENVERHSRPRPYAFKDDSDGSGKKLKCFLEFCESKWYQ